MPDVGKVTVPRILLTVLLALLWGWSGMAATNYTPIASGNLADVNAKDGDAAFNADYYRGSALTGTPMTSRLEGTVGGGGKIPGITGGYSARWSATITPKKSGVFPIALRSIGAATLLVDGRKLIERPGAANDFLQRATSSLAMSGGKPYEFVVEFNNPDGKGRITLEWATPLLSDAKVPDQASARESVLRPAAGTPIGRAITLQNQTYSLKCQEDGTMTLTEKATGATGQFQPEFAVVCQLSGKESKPDNKGGKYQDTGPVGAVNYVVPSWDKEADYLVAAHPRTHMRAIAFAAEKAVVRFTFPAQPDYLLTAEVTLPDGALEPVLTFHLQAKTAAQYSIGYVGAPEAAFTECDWIWQPLVWQDQRFPNRSYLTKEFQCPIPMVMFGAKGNALGVGADAKEMPYRMPTMQDSRFGVLVRNAAGRAQPMLFAPLLGGPDSKMGAGKSYDFTLRFFVRRGTWYDAYKHTGTALYQFSDARENGLCSLNSTIENMMDYLLTDRFSYWYPQYKTWGYQNDGGPGSGRQQSAADAVGLALICDHAQFYKLRALPTVEYMLSRKSVSTSMNRPDFMGGFVNGASDMVAAYRLAGGRSPVIRKLFERPAEGATTTKPQKQKNSSPIMLARNQMLDDLTQYRLTGKKVLLQQACAAADRYIELRINQPARDFRDTASSFWNELSPYWDVLYELYEATGQKKYLTASEAAMRQFAGYIYLVPTVPPGNFTANPGGSYNGQPVPEETVPAWQVSANGLAAECAGTAHSHRGVFMTPYASYLARLGRDTGDALFRDIARNAVVGRYCNYPSYAYRNGYTTLHQKADYPLRSFEEIKKFTSAHYNHVLPMTAFLVDYLISEVYARSDGQIHFPSEYTTTGAYFRNKLYGAQAGRFYDEPGVVPWLPKGLLQTDSVQVNYVAGHGNGKLYLALANQSAQAVTTTLALNPGRVKLAGEHQARVWRGNMPAPSIQMRDGRATVTIAAKGLTCLAIEGAVVQTEIQQAMLDATSPPLSSASFKTLRTPFDEVTATALRFGRGLTTVHVWLKAGPSKVKRATLKWSANGQTQQQNCTAFPYEFTVPVPDEARTFDCEVEAQLTAGSTVKSGPIQLRLSDP